MLERAGFGIEISKRNNWLLSIALDYLSLGKTHTLLFQKNGQAEHRKAAAQHLDAAVAGLEKAGTQHNLPWGFLARAHYRRLLQDWPGAAQDLAAARDIAESGGMRLHLCDYHLESARLALAMGDKGDAREHYEAARALVSETGYHRRDGELEEILAGCEG